MIIKNTDYFRGFYSQLPPTKYKRRWRRAVSLYNNGRLEPQPEGSTLTAPLFERPEDFLRSKEFCKT
jgi:hypothetical protein